jgi:hypothetical protein
VSAYPASASVATESDLFASYMTVPYIKSLPCVCGGTVTADIECPAAGVRDHQRTPEHVGFRGAYGL